MFWSQLMFSLFILVQELFGVNKVRLGYKKCPVTDRVKFQNIFEVYLFSWATFVFWSSYLFRGCFGFIGWNWANMDPITNGVKFNIFLRFTHCINKLLFSGLNWYLTSSYLFGWLGSWIFGWLGYLKLNLAQSQFGSCLRADLGIQNNLYFTYVKEGFICN